MRTRHFVYGLGLLLVANLAAPCYAADDPGAPSTFIAQLARQALRSANDKTLSSIDRQRRFEGLLDKDFNVPRIASFVLGRYWQTASDGERQEFTAVFRDFLARSYSQRFAEYSGEPFRVLRQRAESATSTVVYTEVDRPDTDQPLEVDWRVADHDGYRIDDVSIAGISMALTQREEFSSFLQRNGGSVSRLIRQLQVKMSAQR
jgi:phospholipid transport system substrate-binding protein